eukprot:PITA_05288
MQKPSKCEDYLHLVEFAYNNGYHTSLRMSAFEVLYRCKCRTPLCWSDPEDKLMLGSDMLEEMENMVKSVRNNLKYAQVRQKTFADQKRSFRKFQVGDHVYIHVEPEGEFLVEQVGILDWKEATLRRRVIAQVKNQWQHFGPKEATWEDEQTMREAYPQLFS